MAKQTINLGTGELTGDGESIRSAFDKINDNFNELYATEHDLSSISQSIIPDTDVTYDLGSVTNRFRDLYLSGSTIDLGGTTLSVVGGNLQIGGTDIKDVVTAAGVDYSEIQNTPTIPTAVSDLTNDLDYAGIVGTAIQNNGLPVLPTQTLDIKGSVFGDDSTLLVDGVNGVVAGTLTGNWISSGNKFNVFGEGIDVTTGSSIFSVVDPGLSFTNSYNGESVALSVSGGGLALSGTGNLSIAIDSMAASLSDGITIAVGNDISISAGDFTLSATTINLGGEVNASGNFTGSVFADDSTVLVDGVAGKIRGDIENDTVSITSTSSDTSIFSPSYVGIFTDTNNSFHNFVFDTDGYFKVLTDNGGININNELNFMSSGAPDATLSLDTGVLEVVTNSGFRLKTNTGTTQLEYEENGSGILRIRGDVVGFDYLNLDAGTGGNVEIGRNTDLNIILGQASAGHTAVYSDKFLLKNTTVPSTSIGTASDLQGEFALDANYLYYCTANYDGVTDIWKRVAWSGDTW